MGAHGDWYWITCPDEKCRIRFAIPMTMQSRAERDGQAVKCPNGHGVVWNGGESDAEREAKQLRKRLASEEEVAFQTFDENRSLRAMLRECPACGWRSRKQLPERVRADFAEHLSEKHGLAVVGDLAEQLEG
jgi:hypothetical protein